MMLKSWNAWLDSTLLRQLCSVTLKCPSRAGFLSLDTIDSLGWIILCGGDFSVHWRRFNSIPGLYVLNISTIFPAGTRKNVSWHCQMYCVGNLSSQAPNKKLWLRKRTTISKDPVNVSQWSYLGLSSKDIEEYSWVHNYKNIFEICFESSIRARSRSFFFSFWVLYLQQFLAHDCMWQCLLNELNYIDILPIILGSQLLFNFQGKLSWLLCVLSFLKCISPTHFN